MADLDNNFLESEISTTAHSAPFAGEKETTALSGTAEAAKRQACRKNKS